MSPEKLLVLSSFLNTQADLPVAVAAIAEELKASFAPGIAEATAAAAPAETVAPTEEESVPVEEEPAPSEVALVEDSNG